MLLRCLVDHQMSQNETMHFEPGKVYNMPDELGRRLLQDFGKGSRAEARHQDIKFARVSVEGDVVDVVQDGETVKHTVTADEAYSGEVIEVNEQGPVMAGASGEVDHSHQSQSEPEQPPFGEKLAHDGDSAEHDHTTATQGASGTGAPLGQVGSGQSGDTLSTGMGAPAPAEAPAVPATTPAENVPEATTPSADEPAPPSNE